MRNGQIQEAVIRQNAYSFLASLFLLEPNEETILENQNQINKLLSEVEPPELVEVDSLKQQYYDVFFVPSSGVFVPPFESALRNYQPQKKKPYNHLFGKDAVHVQSCYSAVGFVPWEMDIFQPLKDVRFPDHIGYELAFMSVLCANEAASADVETKAEWEALQLQFLSEHLGEWVGDFAQALEINAEGFYKNAAIATKEWVLEDLQFLEENANVVKGVLS